MAQERYDRRGKNYLLRHKTVSTNLKINHLFPIEGRNYFAHNEIRGSKWFRSSFVNGGHNATIQP